MNNITENKIFVLSGPVHSGKTTRLINWIQSRSDVSGILSPVIHGERFFMNAATKEIFPMEAEPGESNTFTVGKYVFSVLGFENAKEILRQASNQKEGWLIIDEVGPLELEGEGFNNVLKELIKQDHHSKIILVVRESLVSVVVEQYGIENYEDWDFRS